MVQETIVSQLEGLVDPIELASPAEMHETMHKLSGLNSKNVIWQLPKRWADYGAPVYYGLRASDPKAESRVLYIPDIGSHLSVHTSLTMLALDSLNNGDTDIIGVQIPQSHDHFNYSSYLNKDKGLTPGKVEEELKSGSFTHVAQTIAKVVQNQEASPSRLHVVGVGAGAAIAASVAQLSLFMHDNNQLMAQPRSLTLIDPPNTIKRGGSDVESDMRQSLGSLQRAAREENLGYLNRHYQHHFGGRGLLGKAINLSVHNKQYALPMNQALFRGFGEGKLSNDLECTSRVEKLIARSVGHTVCRSLETVKITPDSHVNERRTLVEIEGLDYPIGMSPIAVAVIAKAGIQMSERS